MKIKTLTKIILSLVFVFALSFSFAQVTGPVDPPGGGGDPTEPPVGGGAPIGGGLVIMLAAGAVYGGKKLYSLRNTEEEDLEA